MKVYRMAASMVARKAALWECMSGKQLVAEKGYTKVE